jgi:hypothetical protein
LPEIQHCDEIRVQNLPLCDEIREHFQLVIWWSLISSHRDNIYISVAEPELEPEPKFLGPAPEPEM